ncbi:protein of unknown function [Methylocella tundrae]|uniref:Thioredoxin reductase n=1 Tax=Methylocella tundrae TaxID=227605 RepID=A0A4U8Z2C4_METTU|nr:protein of unknown function [Methylocella tundrae]
MEAKLCEGEEVVVVGGGNSAGQAAVFLARQTAHVHMIVRARDLASTMSYYLIERILASPRITLRTQTEISRLQGGDRLSAITWTHRESGESKTLAIANMFVMIGAAPNTGWLNGCLTLDGKGFVATGAAAGLTGSPLRDVTAGDLCGRRRSGRFDQAGRLRRRRRIGRRLRCSSLPRSQAGLIDHGSYAHHSSVPAPVVLLLLFGVVAAIACRAAKLSPIVGYLALGVALRASGSSPAHKLDRGAFGGARRRLSSVRHRPAFFSEAYPRAGARHFRLWAGAGASRRFRPWPSRHADRRRAAAGVSARRDAGAVLDRRRRRHDRRAAPAELPGRHDRHRHSDLSGRRRDLSVDHCQRLERRRRSIGASARHGGR